jgi:hypothetical protein
VETVQVGDWTLTRRLGEGGMGVVHLAEDEHGNLAALKVLRPHVVGDEEARARLEREVSTLERVRSPWVAEIVDADPWGPVPFVATRFIDGPSLHDQVGTLGPLGAGALHHFASCLAQALGAVHKAGVLHRDVKPSNVVLDGDTPVLIDFGLARLGDDVRLTRTGFLLGTPGYLAPEILHGIEPGPAADVHSWAATVAFAGTGRDPFGSGPPMAVMDRVRRGEHDLTGLDPSMRILVEAALDPDPLRRPTLPALLKRLAAPARAGVAVPVRSGRPLAEPTRVLRDGSPSGDGEDLPLWSAAPPKPRTSLGERLRRWTLGLALLALVVVSVVAAPLLALAGLAVGVAVMRWCAVTADGHRSRRDARGRKWYDFPHAVVMSPVDLLISVPATLLLWVTAVVLGGLAVLGCVIADAPRSQWLACAGAAVGLALWLGPGSSRVRRPVGRLTRPLARTGAGWVLTMMVVLGLAGAAAYAVWQGGTEWMPLNEAPWDARWDAHWLDLIRP